MDLRLITRTESLHGFIQPIYALVGRYMPIKMFVIVIIGHVSLNYEDVDLLQYFSPHKSG